MDKFRHDRFIHIPTSDEKELTQVVKTLYGALDEAMGYFGSFSSKVVFAEDADIGYLMEIRVKKIQPMETDKT